VNKEDILVWLTQLGKEWVGLIDVFNTFASDEPDADRDVFWYNLDDWHNGAYITKRYADAHFNKEYQHSLNDRIEQYRLTKKAIDSLNE
jgi:hypothetical protein